MMCCCGVLPDPLQQSPGQKEVEGGGRGGGHVYRTERKHVNSYSMDTACKHRDTLAHTWLTMEPRTMFMNVKLMDVRIKQQDNVESFEI